MKRFATANLGLIVILLIPSAYGQAPPHNEHLKPMAPLIGTWAGEFTMSTDMAEVGKAGDTLSVMVSYQWTKNRQAIALSAAVKMEGEWVHVTDGLMIYDPGQKKILGMDTYADGGVFRYVVDPQEGKIFCRGHGSTGDGVPTELTVVCSDMMQDSFTGQFVHQKRGDKQIPNGKPYTLHRVKE